jgi:predicted polyphosphate/ATP-dependent NAD kinase
MKKKLGLIVNPVAGMGGRVGLKGSDGPEILMKAIELGAKPQSPKRAIQALQRLLDIKDQIDIITYPDDMGENEVRELGMSPVVIGSIVKGITTPEDTQIAAMQMKEIGVDLILFAGGDGTARNIYNAIGDQVIVLGIPAGVKIHSAVYGQNPKSSGELAALFLQDKVKEVQEAEVMDIDEEAFRAGRVSAKLYGYLKVPYEKRYVQNLKSGGVAGEKATLEQIANYIIDNMDDEHYYIIGPGTTTRPIMEKLGLKNTLLGVDVVYRKKLVANDVNEQSLLKIIEGQKAKIIVTTIGGQGYIFGRGNQQLSPEVLTKVGKENIIIVSTRDKLNTNFGSPLLVDTGDEEINEWLSGYYRVIVGYEDSIMHRVSS